MSSLLVTIAALLSLPVFSAKICITSIYFITSVSNYDIFWGPDFHIDTFKIGIEMVRKVF
jgi:hypothetical protein